MNVFRASEKTLREGQRQGSKGHTTDKIWSVGSINKIFPSITFGYIDLIDYTEVQTPVILTDSTAPAKSSELVVP